MRNPCKLPVDKPRRRKYDAIMCAACDLFLRHGYTRTSMDAVAKLADVSKQTVYSYFKNKDDLFCQMIEDECKKHTPEFCLMKNAKMKPAETLYCIGKSFLNMISNPRGVAIYKLVMSEANHHPRIGKLFFEHGLLHMQKLLADYLNLHNNKYYTIDNVEAAASNFFALIKGRYNLQLALRIKPLPTQKQLDAHIHETVRLFEKLYAK